MQVSPVCHKYWDFTPTACALQQDRAPRWEARTLQLESALTTTRESPRAASKIRRSQLKKNNPNSIFKALLLQVVSLVAQTVKNPPAMWETWVWSLGWEDPLERKWQPTPVFLPGESHGQRSLVGYSPWDHKESDHDWWTFTYKGKLAGSRICSGVPLLRHLSPCFPLLTHGPYVQPLGSVVPSLAPIRQPLWSMALCLPRLSTLNLLYIKPPFWLCLCQIGLK